MGLVFPSNIIHVFLPRPFVKVPLPEVCYLSNLGRRPSRKRERMTQMESIGFLLADQIFRER